MRYPVTISRAGWAGTRRHVGAHQIKPATRHAWIVTPVVMCAFAKAAPHADVVTVNAAGKSGHHAAPTTPRFHHGSTRDWAFRWL